uniref:Uncharacterized protein n=1 Tax=Pseudictyota dubia TaxID=2749911 RepID=A0A7R9ZEB3_9STRA|mmetsp:Transcript_46961/g.87199  ORF Transcript_46961/g.87199 Transcript_46961/m.87199 type:complete len:139 (+) Transcript_46961:247-663(+)
MNKEGGRGRRRAGRGKRGNANSAQVERRKKEQKRKLLAANRRGVRTADGDDRRTISDTERILGLVASNRMMGGGGDAGGNNEVSSGPAQVLVGSATASRKALDRLNAALRPSASAASMPFGMAWFGDVKLCRADDEVV